MPVRKPMTVEEVFRTNLSSSRDARGWSQAKLAEEMGEVGYPIDRSAIARVENGERNVTVQEAIAFAAALGVAPVHLFVPREHGASMLLRGKGVLEARARDWFVGARPLRPVEDWDAFSTQVPEAVKLARQHAGAQMLAEWVQDISGYLIEASAGQLPTSKSEELGQLIELLTSYLRREQRQIEAAQQRQKERGR